MGSLKDFPGSPVIKTSSNAGGTDSVTGQGAKIPHSLHPKCKILNRSHIITNSIKTLKKVHIKKKQINKKKKLQEVSFIAGGNTKHITILKDTLANSY